MEGSKDLIEFKWKIVHYVKKVFENRIFQDINPKCNRNVMNYSFDLAENVEGVTGTKIPQSSGTNPLTIKLCFNIQQKRFLKTFCST